MPLHDITGQPFGRLTVREFVGRRSGSSVWRCECECGGIVDVRRSNLISGNTRSCGCMIVKRTVERSTVHGEASRGGKSPEYKTWVGIIKRCTDPKAKGWPNYGGRGIHICDEWRHSYAAFLADVGRKPSPRHSIDRIDNDGNYEPGNVRWATRSEQNSNQRRWKTAQARP